MKSFYSTLTLDELLAFADASSSDLVQALCAHIAYMQPVYNDGENEPLDRSADGCDVQCPACTAPLTIAALPGDGTCYTLQMKEQE